jgi:acylaminoacyl-peptidase
MASSVQEPLGFEEEIRLYERLAMTREFKRAWCFGENSSSSSTEAEAPSPTSFQVLLSATQRVVAQNKQRRTVFPVRVTPTQDKKEEGDQSPPVVQFCSQVPEDCLLMQPSPSGEFTLYARSNKGGMEENGGKKGGPSVIWELCGRDGQLIKQIHVPQSLHGPVYAEGYISRGVSWSPDEQSVAYVAEVPQKHTTPNWGSNLVANANDSLSNNNNSHVDTNTQGSLPEAYPPTLSYVGETEGKPTSTTNEAASGGGGKSLGSWTGQGPYEEDFGELFPGKKQAAVYLMNVKEGSIAQVCPEVTVESPEDAYGQLDAVTCGKPVFSPDSKFLVFTVWPHIQKQWRDENGSLAAAKKLGIIYCYNRECHLQLIRCSDVWKGKKGEEVCADRLPLQPLASAHSAVFSPEILEVANNVGKSTSCYTLLFLSHDSAHKTGVHNSCASLHSLLYSAEETAKPKFTDQRVLVPVVGTPESRDSFQGLFCADLNGDAICDDVLFLTSVHRCNTAILGVNITSGKVQMVTDPSTKSWSIIGAGEKKLIASTAAPGEAPSVHMYCCKTQAWSPVYKTKDAKALDVSIKIQEHKPDPEKSNDSNKETFDSILLTPPQGTTTKNNKNGDSLLLIPHGGPHSAHICNWNIQYEFLLNLGYTLLLVNYRGSIGFGNASLLSLPGFIGDHDVHDCMKALTHTLDANTHLARVAVMGGSHGGFLTLHLLGQHPEAFGTGVVRNPVTSIPGMLPSTDIPDWCYVESLGVGVRPKCFGPTTEDYDKMMRVSPMFHVRNVRAPTLWLLGAQDARVPADPARDYMAALKSKNLKMKLIVFPKDSHPLSKPQTEFESYINICWWLQTHL